mmetsp:Transcript_16631/g.24670  ORF Transcript_16631/g.24670 Transcript_16631/m.24670 type:complete len:167 (+) Transcript_16631:287-787(+)
MAAVTIISPDHPHHSFPVSPKISIAITLPTQPLLPLPPFWPLWFNKPSSPERSTHFLFWNCHFGFVRVFLHDVASFMSGLGTSVCYVRVFMFRRDLPSLYFEKDKKKKELGLFCQKSIVQATDSLQCKAEISRKMGDYKGIVFQNSKKQKLLFTQYNTTQQNYAKR